MPIYQTTKTYRAGFYDAKNKDRTYSAKDMRKPYDVVFTDGLLPIADGTVGDAFKVSMVSNKEIMVGEGEGKVGGAWFTNDGNYRILLDDSTNTDRYDCVILRNDDNDDVRAPLIYIKSLNHTPTVADLERNSMVYELCIAYIYVPAFADEVVVEENIVDTREDGSLCFAMTGVGATVIQTFYNTYFTESENQTDIPIGITNYSKDKDKLTVTVEGRIFIEGTNYDIVDDEYIRVYIGFPVVGTKVAFEATKNVNGKGAETVIAEVEDLLKRTSSIEKNLEHHYYCNGVNDNILISRIAQAYHDGGIDYRSMRLVVHGTFGATSAYSGSGTSGSKYVWIALGKEGVSSTRRLIVDFTDCTSITLPISAGTSNVVFAGNDVHIIGANVIANQTSGFTTICMFGSTKGAVVAEHCRFWITASGSPSFISQNGRFVNCRGSVTVNRDNAYCFLASQTGVLRVDGGEYYAYTSKSDGIAAIVYQDYTKSCSILYGVSTPTVARSGYYQTNSIYQTDGYVNCTDLISNTETLPMKVVAGKSNIRGNIPFDITNIV